MLKMGIIGFGKMAEFHAGWMTAENQLELVAICEKNPNRVEEIHKIYSVPVYGNVDEFLAIPGMDFVVITTTNEVHADLTIRALECGKNVIVEKPMAMDYASTLKMIQAAEKNHRHLFIHQSGRWDRDYLLLKDILMSGILGDLLLVKQEVMLCDEGWPAWGIEGMANPWRIKAKFGGGMLYDWGPHLIDWAMQLIGKDPESVYCILQNGVWSKDADDYSMGIMRFENNLVCQFEASNNARLPVDRFYVVGSRGTFLVKGKKFPVWDEAEMVIVNANGEQVHQKWELIGAKELLRERFARAGLPAGRTRRLLRIGRQRVPSAAGDGARRARSGTPVSRILVPMERRREAPRRKRPLNAGLYLRLEGALECIGHVDAYRGRAQRARESPGAPAGQGSRDGRARNRAARGDRQHPAR